MNDWLDTPLTPRTLLQGLWNGLVVWGGLMFMMGALSLAPGDNGVWATPGSMKEVLLGLLIALPAFLAGGVYFHLRTPAPTPSDPLKP